MIDLDWVQVDTNEVFMVALSAIVIYAAILLYTRLTGLRSFSKMSASDFAMTVAVGSLFASSISNPNPTIGVALIALGCLFAGQWLLAILRAKSSSFVAAVGNQPYLLMRGDQFLRENMAETNVTEEDIIAKLREANVLNMEQVKAVIFETTGDISVLHSKDATLEIDPKILEGVKTGA